MLSYYLCRFGKNSVFYAVIMLLVLGGSVMATPNFQVDMNYPNLGLKMRTLSSSNPEPLSQPTIYTYMYTKGDFSKKIKMYDPFEIWYADQHGGQWRDSKGNVFIIAQPKNMLPKFKAKHILFEDYQKSIDTGKFNLDVNRTDELESWIKDFCKLDVSGVEVVKTRSFDLQNCMFYSTSDPSTLVYSFSLKPKGLGTRIPETYVAVLQVFDGTSPKKARQSFENQFLRSVRSLPKNMRYPSNYTVGQKMENVEDDSPSSLAAAKSLENMDGWWSQRVGDYIFVSDIKNSKGRKLISFLEYTMPVIRKAFVEAIPPIKKISDVSVIRIFEKPEGYRQHLDSIGEWTTGVWQPAKRELTVLYQSRDQEKSIETIIHEALHQYLFYATDMIQNAPWFNEGYACFFQTAVVTSKGTKVLILEQKAYVDYITKNLNRISAHLPILITKDYEAFYEPDVRQLNYVAAWSLVYFLQKNRSSSSKLYESILPDYLEALKRDKNYSKATEYAFRNVDMMRFQQDFQRFWKRDRYSAARYTPFESL
jgi:hypothetical protein